jgi:hypothetical protein
MPLFLFSLRDRKMEFRFDHAEEFPGIAEAKQHACQVARELARNNPRSELGSCSIVVKDAAGCEVVRVELVGPVRASSRSRRRRSLH